MELHKIREVLEKSKLIVFGPGYQEIVKEGGYKGSPCVFVDINSKTIKFTSDIQDYTMRKKLEEVLEMLFKEFGIDEYIVQFHHHKGEHHDKDIILKMETIEKFPEIIKFIKDNFYKVDEWNFAVL